MRELKAPTDIATCSTLALPPPISTIPVEILLGIFTLCQSNGAQDDPTIPALHHISLVCSHWRAVALATPHLWARIALWNPEARHELMVQNWLDRSRGCPLTLIIRHSASEPSAGWDVVAKNTGRTLQRLLQHTVRWKSVLFDIKRIPVSDLPAVVGQMQLLEHLDVTDREQTFCAASISFWESILSQSSLRRVRWHCAQPDWTGLVPTMEHCHWERLTQISGHFDVDDGFVEALCRCEVLEVLELTKLTAPGAPLLHRPHVILPCLHTLKFLWCRDSIVTSLINRLITPNLRHMETRVLGQGSLAAWVELLNRSNCALRISTIWIEEPTSETDLVRFLTSPSIMPVAELELAVRPLSDFVVQTLKVQPHNTPVPLLQRLSLVLKDCSEGLCAAMVQSRLAAQNSELRKIFINNFTRQARSISSADFRYFQQLRSKGFDVSYLGK